ncbi:hypothetical protein [Pseudomonas sp. Ps21-P2]|uniref:hypothetical protein n=1 Tax=Pseudomonas sp. Ps21-P2 TaxID=3080331 RepID=UPI00320AD7EC
MFDDFFAPIARDGATIIEVDIRLLKVLRSLAHINPALFSGVAARQANLLLRRSEIALTLDEDKQKLRSLAGEQPHK